MTEKQKRFADEYLIDLDEGRAYMAAYPTIKHKNAACACASRLLNDAKYHAVQEYIRSKLEAMRSSKTADAKEVLEYLSAVMRGRSESEIVVTEGTGDGCSEARTMIKRPDEKERLKAAELLAKYHQLLVPRVQLEAEKGGGLIILAEATEGEP